MSNFKFGTDNIENAFQLVTYHFGGERENDTGFKIGGSDIKNRYSIIKDYSPNNLTLENNTGFKINGVDIKNIFAKKNEVKPHRTFEVEIQSSKGETSRFNDAYQYAPDGPEPNTNKYPNGGNGVYIKFGCSLQVGETIMLYKVLGGKGGYSKAPNTSYHWDGGNGGDTFAFLYKDTLICIPGGGGGGGTNHYDGDHYGGSGGVFDNSDPPTGANNYANGIGGNNIGGTSSTGGHGGGATSSAGGARGDAYNYNGGARHGVAGKIWNSSSSYYYYQEYTYNGDRNVGRGGGSGGGTSHAAGGGGGAGLYGGGGGGGVAHNGANRGGGSAGGGSTFLRLGHSTYGNATFIACHSGQYDSPYVNLIHPSTNKARTWNSTWESSWYYTIPDPLYENL